MEAVIQVDGRFSERLKAIAALVEMPPEETVELCFYYGLGHLEALYQHYPRDFRAQIEAIKSFNQIDITATGAGKSREGKENGCS